MMLRLLPMLHSARNPSSLLSLAEAPPMGFARKRALYPSYDSRTHVSGTEATCSLNAWRDEIAAYQRSRFGIGGRSGMSCT